MSAMKNLDLMLQHISDGAEDYEENKSLISMHLDGQLAYDKLPEVLQRVVMDWEVEEMELENNQLTDEEIEAW